MSLGIQVFVITVESGMQEMGVNCGVLMMTSEVGWLVLIPLFALLVEYFSGQFMVNVGTDAWVATEMVITNTTIEFNFHNWGTFFGEKERERELLWTK